MTMERMNLNLCYVLVGALVLCFNGGNGQEDHLGLWMFLGGMVPNVQFGPRSLQPTAPLVPLPSPPLPPAQTTTPPMFRPPSLPTYITRNPRIPPSGPPPLPPPIQQAGSSPYSDLPDTSIVRLAPGIAMRAEDYRLLNAAVKFIVGPNAAPNLDIVRVVLGHRGIPRTLQQMLEYVPVLQEINRRTPPEGGTRRRTKSEILLRALRYYDLQQKTLGVGTGTILF